MTDKEFKRLSRSQLIDIIYQLQLKQEELIAENEKLSKDLDDKRLRVNKAEAALEIHNVMQAAQDAAAHYMGEVKIRATDEYRQIVKKANDKAAAIIENAYQEATEIVMQAQKEKFGYNPMDEAVFEEYEDYQ